MNIENIVKNKTQNLIESGDIEKMVQENIEKSVKSAIGSLFGGYSFKSDIEKKLAEEIDPILKNIDLSAYKEVVHARAIQIIESTLDADLSEKAQEQYKKLFMIDDKEIKLSDIFEMVREYFTDDRECSYGEYFTFIINEKDERDNFIWTEIYFDNESDQNKDDCDFFIQSLKHKDGNNRITRLKLDRFMQKQEDKLMLFRPGHLVDFERILLNMFLKDSNFIIDISEGDVNTALFDD